MSGDEKSSPRTDIHENWIVREMDLIESAVKNKNYKGDLYCERLRDYAKQQIINRLERNKLMQDMKQLKEDFESIKEKREEFAKLAKVCSEEIERLKDDRLILLEYADYAQDYLYSIDINNMGLNETQKGLLALAILSVAGRGREAAGFVRLDENLAKWNRDLQIHNIKNHPQEYFKGDKINNLDPKHKRVFKN